VFFFFYWRNFAKNEKKIKSKNPILKIKKRIFWRGFQSPEERGKKEEK
jgi:hypothetical protein